MVSEVSEEEYDSESEYEDCFSTASDGSGVSTASGDDEAEASVPEEVREKVTELIQADACEQHCLRGKAREIGNFWVSFSALDARGQKQAVMTTLSTLIATYAGRAEERERMRFAYSVPLVGKVCRDSFCNLYDISTPTVARYRARIESGAFHVKPHGLAGNKNAQIMDEEWLVQWYRSFANEVGQVVPVRVRRVERSEGRIVHRYSHENHILFPSYFTWERLHEEMMLGVSVSMIRRAEPSEAVFRHTVQRLCPDIGIRSPRDNVCDACVIYANKIRRSDVTGVAELLGEHTFAARAMRSEYKNDCANASDNNIVLTMDYAQNLALPHVAETPSQWYFMSLIAVSVFGIHSAKDARQTNYVYTERKGGKGSNEVVSMLHRHLMPTESNRKLTIYADNCGGQNKNNFVVKYLLLLAHVGFFEEVTYKFFVRGHTKNACDRGFGSMKKYLARHDCWTLKQLKESLDNSACSSTTVMLDEYEKPFGDFKDVLNELYKNLPAIQPYQIFKMRRSEPGVVECMQGPSSTGSKFDLRRTYDSIRVTKERALELIGEVPDQECPPVNPEKIRDIHTNVRPYVPEEFEDDALYAAPTDLQLAASKSIKKRRAMRAKDLRAARERPDEEEALQRLVETRGANVASTAAEFHRRERSGRPSKKTRKTRDDTD